MSTTIFLNLLLFICWTILSNIFTSISNHIIYMMYMSIAIACGVHICIERQPYNSDTRENKRIKSYSLTTAASSVSGSLHVVCSICTVIPRCALSACSLITVCHQPFNKITYQYSLSSYNFTALYQLNIF